MDNIYYNEEGEEVSKEAINCVAKKIVAASNKQGYSYFIKVYNQGAASGQLYNPVSMWNDVSRTRCWSDAFAFKKVNEEVFKTYLKFLDTKNVLYLRSAERGKCYG